MPEKIKEVAGLPAKTFFVSMLTRDIELQDAILDLLDNCVDGALRTRSKTKAVRDSLDGFHASITFDENRFVIQDNCGGIPWKNAKNYAFRMGKPEGVPEEQGTIGVVGIGMKRAVFKMGRECHVLSEHKDDSFMVSIEPTWFTDDNHWEFKAERTKPSRKDHGTIIEITKLLPSVRIAFKEGSTFRGDFPQVVADSYSYLIEKGFGVTINNIPVRPRPVRLFVEKRRSRKAEPLIQPFIYTGDIDEVSVFLTVGYRSALKTSEEQDAENEQATFSARDAGWTIICNDRVVLTADRTVKTGWGVGGVPQFHNQFSPIAGIVEFTSKHTDRLPVTTTKRGVDLGKDVYIKVRQKMQEGLKHFTTNTNRWKGDESELKARFEDKAHASYLELSELKSRVAAGEFPMRALAGPINGKQYKPTLPEKQIVETERTIKFRRDVDAINLVSNYLFGEVREPSEVGEVCFDRTFDKANK